MVKIFVILSELIIATSSTFTTGSSILSIGFLDDRVTDGL